jgi:hypothetical protein
MFGRSFTLCTEDNEESPAAVIPQRNVCTWAPQSANKEHIRHRIQQSCSRSRPAYLSICRPRPEQTALLPDKACSPDSIEKLHRATEPFSKLR